ncbi:MAG: VCBS repeat-containing protein, partial [Candidatus Sabulitectum sp.]|nr:VCBS repeat-containing protein [Candidatus Sabulitectum sp.]
MDRYLLPLLLLSAVSFAETATQTDWSGGGGIPGPVTDWGNNYDIADLVNHSGNSLCLISGILAYPVKHTVDGNFDGAYSVYATDVDGDGDVDVLGAAFDDNEIIWWENTNGTGTSWIEHLVDGDFNAACSVYATDVDGDGDVDVLGAAFGGDDITWWENTDSTGTSWTEHTIETDFSYARSVFAIDVDGDDDVDVLGAAWGSGGAIKWWENIDGTGSAWTEHLVDGAFGGAYSVYATDVDGDGDVDVLGAAAGHNDITWWENSDTAPGIVWTEHTVDDNFPGAGSVYATDVDGDGDVDVLGVALNADDICWWENTNGTGTSWTEHTVDDEFDGVRQVYATDLDGDGDTDVLGAACDIDDINWWENADGTGTLWTEHTVDGDYYGAWAVYAADVDGDGHIDVLGAAGSVSDEITWWDVTGFSPAGTLESSVLDVDSVDHWENFTSTGDEPAVTSLGFQFRSSNDSANMGTWSDTVFTNTSLSGILADSTDFLQYRVILQTTDPSSTPVLDDVSFSYTTYLGIADDEATSWGLAP